MTIDHHVDSWQRRSPRREGEIKVSPSFFAVVPDQVLAIVLHLISNLADGLIVRLFQNWLFYLPIV